jgi:hypothetical protein
MRVSRIHLGAFGATSVLLKKSGKPLETPPYKQVYLPYDDPPTAAELERERRKFAKVKGNTAQTRDQTFDVVDKPENFYTYGKEGMSIPISIWKDQPDPVIAAEHTYPGIYENKVALKLRSETELIAMRENNSWDSPWQEDMLRSNIDEKLRKVRWRMMFLKDREENVFLKERKIPTPGAKGAKGSNPDKGKAAAAAPADKAKAAPAAAAGKK